jgi:hypothetical protein
MGYHPASPDVTNSLFGITTRKTVVEFQTAHSLTPAGIVDEATAVLLFQEAACREPWRYVFGLIHHPNGTLGSALDVRVFARSLRREILLAQTCSDEAGYYHCDYLLDEPDQGRQVSADILVRVSRDDEILYDPTTNDIVYQAAELTILNINLTRGDTGLLDVYTSIVNSVSSILKDQGIELAELTLDDITFLTNDTGLDPVKLTQTVVAAKIQSKYHIPGEFSFAVFAEGGLSTQSQTSVTGLRVQVGLSSDVTTLLYDMVLTPFSALTTSVQTAISENLIPSGLADQLPSVQKMLTAHLDEANAYIKQNPLDAQLLSQIQDNLANGVGDAVQSFFQNGAYGDLSYVLSSMSTALKPSTSTTSGTASGASTTQASSNPITTPPTTISTEPHSAPLPNSPSSLPAAASSSKPDAELDPPLSSKPPPAPDQPPDTTSPSSLISRILELQQVKSEKELSKFSENDWIEAMKHPELESSSASSEWRQAQAKVLLKSMESKYPTSAFAAQFKRDANSSLSHSKAMSDILDNNPDFDLAKGDVRVLFQAKSSTPVTQDETATMEQLKAVQRIFKLAPTFQQTKALLESGIKSSAAIKAMGKSRFVAEFGSDPSHPFTTSQAVGVFHKAESIHIATTLLAGELHSLTSSLSINGLSAPLPPGHLQSITEEFPNLSTLFQLGDACSCDSCMTVYSASAYLVDALMFLSQRAYLDTTSTPPKQGVDAKQVLFSRRADLGDLDLSCSNTNTTLPYIDLVCELLEDAAAKSNGFEPFSVTNTLTTGLISKSPGLLATLTTLGYPFTDKATVSDPDISTKSRVVRDTLIVVKLTPPPAGSANPDWTGQELKQSYKSSDELAAAPYYVNSLAYTTLASSKFAFNLPFDLSHQETLAYFAQFGISRSSLMHALFNPSSGASALDIACEELSITPAERDLIIAADVGGQSKYWNLASVTDVKVGLGNVGVLVTKAGIQYSDLQTIMTLGLTTALSWLNPSNNLYIVHTDSSCNLPSKQIANLKDADADRLHRFLRLWKKLKGSGWDIASVDQAIAAKNLGNSQLDEKFPPKLADLQRLRSKLPSLSIPECVNLFDTLYLDGALYAAVFLNVPANGPIDTNFLPANVKLNEQAESATPGSGKTVSLAPIQAYFALCLGRTSADIALLLGSLPKGLDEPFSTASITSVYLRHMFAMRSKLSIPNLMVLRTLTGLDELSDPKSTISLLESLAAVQSSGLTLVDLQFFLLNQGTQVALGTLHDEVITTLLTGLQKGYLAAQKNDASPFNTTATSAENISDLLTSANKLPGFTSNNSNDLQSMLENTWAKSSPTPATFIDTVLGPFIPDTGPIKAAQSTLASLPTTATKGDIESAKLALISIIAAGISSYLYNQDKQALVLAMIEQEFGVDEDLAGLALTIEVPTILPRSLMTILTDDFLITPLPSAPQVTPPALNPSDLVYQFKTLRFLKVMLAFILKLGLSISDITWMIANCQKLKWMSPLDVMYESDVPAVSFDSWTKLWHGLQLSRKFQPVTNPADPSNPFSMYGFFTLVTSPGTLPGDALNYLSNVTGWDETMVNDLYSQFASALSNYTNPAAVYRLESATAMLRTLNMTVGLASNLIKPTLLPTDPPILRNALKALYSDSSWLGVLKKIMDPLRVMKRDALVNYLLLSNNSVLGQINSVDDIYDYFLIDSEMGPTMLTSRIVQGHATVQLFTQRCLMGLESACVAETTTDAEWLQWNTWMAQFQVWVANKKVFLWPENYIIPNLRDNKSEIFEDFENSLQQNQPSSATAETSTIAYLEALNGISQLEVVCTYTEDATRVMHVFARTKGGDPLVYYYRQFAQEQSWTPWKKVNVKITDDHFIAFTRNGRLSIAWLQMQLETQQDQGQQYPPTTTNPPLQRWNIQLAVSAQDLAGNWGAPNVSKTPLYYPDWGYDWSTDLPPSTDFHIFSWDLGDAVGQAITVTLTWNTVFPAYDQKVDGAGLFIGSFSLGGCKGYPEPNPPALYHQYLNLLPRFRNCLMLPEAYTKSIPVATGK